MTSDRGAKDGGAKDRGAKTVGACHDPYLRCAFYGAAQTAVGVAHACVLAHSPQGCELLVGTAFGWQQADYIETKSLCTKLCEDEIVHGGEETLARTIEEAKVFDVPVVFVLSACGPEIVGDNIPAVCREMAAKVPFRLVPIECAGFRGSQYDGVDIALDAVLKSMLDEPGESPAERAIPNSVVLIAPHGSSNPTWPGDLTWVKATLERLGLRVLVSLTHRTPLEDIGLAARAEWSLVLSHDCGYRAAAELEGRGVKPLLPEVPLPIGFAGTTRWLRVLGETLGREREAETLIDEGEKFTVEQCRRQGLEIQFFNRTRVAILADATLGLPLLRVAVEDLEMEPVAVGLRSNQPRALAMLEAEAKELGTPLPVVPGLDVYGAKRILTDLHPDAVLASNIERHMAAEAGVTYCFRVANPVSRFRLTDRAYFGYTGFLNLMEIIQNDWWDTFRSKKKRWEAKW